MKHGFLLLDKPAGVTSHDCVAIARKELNERKIGHLGTLDPAATGLMVLAVGAKALKVIELFEKASKTYEATITFGTVSSTYDQDGVLAKVTLPKGFTEPSKLDIERVIADQFLGDITQVPPQHSAIHIDGERAYTLARKGLLVDMPQRQVHISSFAILEYSYPTLRVSIACSSGTYIRSLAHDLGQALHCGAYLTDLRRTRVGQWSVDFAVAPKQCGWSFVLPLKEVLDSLPSLDLSTTQWNALKVGQMIEVPIEYPMIGWYEGYPVTLLEPYSKNPELTKPRKVL